MPRSYADESREKYFNIEKYENAREKNNEIKITNKKLFFSSPINPVLFFR
ncbi:MAG: hypothetical protein M1393_06990 [Candidatus Thermoplasmatota archaeon]|nr:hypothetical protein [Candidatus Thermoplasmatota archaeon]